MAKPTKYWCRECGAYDASPCGNVGHISEQMRRTGLRGVRWRPFKPSRLVIAQPPASGRGALEWVPCNADGAPKAGDS